MDCTRVYNILKSAKNIPVYYNDNPIWIEEVYEYDNTVKIKNLSNEKESIVSIDTLYEQKIDEF